MRTNLHPDEAIRICEAAAGRMKFFHEREKVSLDQGLGRVLPSALASPIDHPPFDKSAMDGFAFRTSPANGIYRVMEAIAAGEWSDRPIGEGEVARIMTGAPLPPGAIGVQRIEWTRSVDRDGEGRMLVAFTKPESATNIIRKGENLKAGMELLGPRVLAPQDIGILAAGGISEIEVLRKPRIGIVSTGDEIAQAGYFLPPASIYDSNGPQLKAQAEAAGAMARFYGIARDEGEALKRTLALAFEANDVVIVSGGVSMGDFDFVPSVLSSLEVEPLFHSIAMRPGKPTFFGRRGETAVFGLPGNPVSTFVNFEVLVKAYLRALQGIKGKPTSIRVRLGKALARKGSDRVEFLPATLSSGDQGMVATPLLYHGSSMITALANTDAFLRMEIGQEKIEEGAFVDARLVRP